MNRFGEGECKAGGYYHKFRSKRIRLQILICNLIISIQDNVVCSMHSRLWHGYAVLCIIVLLNYYFKTY